MSLTLGAISAGSSPLAGRGPRGPSRRLRIVHPKIDPNRLVADLDQSGFIRSGRFVVQFEDYPHFAEFWRCLVSAVGSGRNPIVDGLSVLTFRSRAKDETPNINDLLAQYRKAFEPLVMASADDVDRAHLQLYPDPLLVALRIPLDVANPLDIDLGLLQKSHSEAVPFHALTSLEVYWDCHRGLAALQIWETVSHDPEVTKRGCHDVYSYLHKTLAGWATYLGLGQDPWTLARTDTRFFRDRLGSIRVGLPSEPTKL